MSRSAANATCWHAAWSAPPSAQPVARDSEADVVEKVDFLVDLMGLGAFREKLTGELSTGTRRIVELACLLASDPT